MAGAGGTPEQLPATDSNCLPAPLPARPPAACRARGQPLYDSDEQEALLDWEARGQGQQGQGEVADIQEEVQATYGHAYGGRLPGGCATPRVSSELC